MVNSRIVVQMFPKFTVFGEFSKLQKQKATINISADYNQTSILLNCLSYQMIAEPPHSNPPAAFISSSNNQLEQSQLSLSPLSPSDKYIFVSISRSKKNSNKKDRQISNQGSAVTQHSDCPQSSSFYRNTISQARGELEEYQAFQHALLTERTDNRKIRVYSSSHSLQLTQKQSLVEDCTATPSRESQAKKKLNLSNYSTPKLKLTIQDRPRLKSSLISCINNLSAIKKVESQSTNNFISRQAMSQQLINRKLELINPSGKLTLSHLAVNKQNIPVKTEAKCAPNPQQIESDKQPPYSNCFFFSQN